MNRHRIKRISVIVLLLIIIACLIPPCSVSFDGTSVIGSDPIRIDFGIQYAPIFKVGEKTVEGFSLSLPDRAGIEKLKVNGTLEREINMSILLLEIIVIMALYALFIFLFCWKLPYKKSKEIP